jgi:RND superfamily putative drug exporter
MRREGEGVGADPGSGGGGLEVLERLPVADVDEAEACVGREGAVESGAAVAGLRCKHVACAAPGGDELPIGGGRDLERVNQGQRRRVGHRYCPHAAISAALTRTVAAKAEASVGRWSVNSAPAAAPKTRAWSKSPAIAEAMRRAAASMPGSLTSSYFSTHEPLDVLVENGSNAQAIAAKLRAVRGVVGATAPAGWQRGSDSLVEAFPAIDGSAPGIQGIVDRVNEKLQDTGGTLTGVTAVDRDFLHALFGSFPYVLALVLVLTLVLLARAFRSVMLAVKAALLNLVSLAAAFGVVVLVFQQGHGSGLWGLAPTDSVIAWIPLMIFAFLYGLSMDYEVFMLSRIREAYDESGSTEKAIELGLARTGKLVTSGALILMFAFLVLSTSPGYEVKPLAIGVGAGIILDATVIRALLVPAFMRLMGDWNWWMPSWTHAVLRVPRQEPSAQIAAEAA